MSKFRLHQRVWVVDDPAALKAYYAAKAAGCAGTVMEGPYTIAGYSPSWKVMFDSGEVSGLALWISEDHLLRKQVVNNADLQWRRAAKQIQDQLWAEKFGDN